MKVRSRHLSIRPILGLESNQSETCRDTILNQIEKKIHSVAEAWCRFTLVYKRYDTQFGLDMRAFELQPYI